MLVSSQAQEGKDIRNHCLSWQLELPSLQTSWVLCQAASLAERSASDLEHWVQPTEAWGSTSPWIPSAEEMTGNQVVAGNSSCCSAGGQGQAFSRASAQGAQEARCNQHPILELTMSSGRLLGFQGRKRMATRQQEDSPSARVHKTPLDWAAEAHRDSGYWIEDWG